MSPRNAREIILEAAHCCSTLNRHELEKAEKCGCFCCEKVFSPDEIKEFFLERGFADATAVCPHCGIDSVLPALGEPCPADNPKFLSAMNEKYFGIRYNSSEADSFLTIRKAVMQEEGWI